MGEMNSLQEKAKKGGEKKIMEVVSEGGRRGGLVGWEGKEGWWGW